MGGGVSIESQPPPRFIVTAWLLKLKGVLSFETSRINNLLFSVNLQRLGYGNLRLLKVPNSKIFVLSNWIVKRCKKVRWDIHVISHERVHGSNVNVHITTRACDNSVGIATRYGLDGPGIESRKGGGRDFPHPSTAPGVHPASYTMDTGSFPGVKRPWNGVDHTSPSVAEVKGK